MITPVEQHYSPDDLAPLLRVSVRTIRRWCASGRIPRARRLGPRLFRVPASAVNAFLECQRG
jgi:excisionase family DNA binding protein